MFGLLYSANRSISNDSYYYLNITFDIVFFLDTFVGVLMLFLLHIFPAGA